MWHQRIQLSCIARMLAASCMFFVGGSAAKAQYRGPREYPYGGARPNYSRADNEQIAHEITSLSKARLRGEDVRAYQLPEPTREYAEVYDSRYYEAPAPLGVEYVAEPERPGADDQRPVRAPSAGHTDVPPPYGRFPIGRSVIGGEDRPDAPGYTSHAGRDSALANGYYRRGVAEFTGGRGQGVRLDDLYPLDPSVNPRAYRGHYDYRTYNDQISQVEDDRDTEAFIRREMMVRPGANLRVSSTGTYTFRNYVDYGNQVLSRFRLPVHRRYQDLSQ